MKRYASLLLAITASCFFTICVQAQNWVWQSPRPQGNPLKSVKFVNTNYGWAVGDCGAIMHTIDGGLHWTIQISNTKANFYSVYFTDTDRGWAVGDTIMHTTNGGATWIGNMYGIPRDEFVSVQFVDANRGWICGLSGTIAHTTNGGLYWNYHNNSFLQVNGAFFLDTLYGWLNTGNGVYRSTDGGASWYYRNEFSYLTNSITFTNRTNGWVTDYAGYFYHTTDGGSNWLIQFHTNQELQECLNYVTFSDSLHGWAIGECDSVYHTMDGGFTWHGQVNPANAGLLSASFTDNNHGWFVGYDGAVVNTTNAGINWNPQTDLPPTWLSGVTFPNPMNGWVVGYGGTILHTNNGGVNWAPQTSGRTVFLNSVAFTDSNNGWIAGDSGLVLHTGNRGATWVPQTTNQNKKLNRVVFTNSINGWIVADSGKVLYTINGGASWTTRNLGFANNLLDLCWLNNTNGYICGNGKILHTTNTGSTWTDITPISPRNFVSICFVDTSYGWSIANQSALYYTTNSGYTWNSRIIDSAASCTFNRIRFTDTHNGWIVGNNDCVYHTTDGGINWLRQHVTTNYLNDIAFADSGNGWIVGAGTILHSQNPTFGTLSGTVRTITGNLPYRFVTISTGGRTAITDTSGTFSFANLPTGNIVVSARAAGATSIDTMVAIYPNQTTTLNLRMTAPLFHITLNRQDTVLRPNDSIYSVVNSLTTDVIRYIYLRNPGDAPVVWRAQLEFDQSHPLLNPSKPGLRRNPVIEEVNDIYDSVFSFDATQAVGGDRALNGVEFDGTYYWITGANNFNMHAKLYKISKSGQLLRSFNCLDTTSLNGWHDLAFDGHYLYASYTRFIDKIDTANGQVVRRYTTTVDPARALTIDTIAHVMYYCDQASSIYKMRLSDGIVIDTLSNPGGVFGMAWYPADEDSMPLYLICRDSLSNTLGSKLYKINPVSHTRFPLVSLGRTGERAAGLTVTSRWNPVAWTSVTLLSTTGGNSRIAVNMLALNTNWVSLNPSNGYLIPGASDSVRVWMLPVMLIPGQYRLLIRFNSSTALGDVAIPLILIINEPSSSSESNVTVPVQFGLERNYPNPFNPATTIQFTLDHAQLVKLVLYDINGREVAQLANGAMAAGSHSLQFNAGTLSSGVYFVRLTGERNSITRKITLLK